MKLKFNILYAFLFSLAMLSCSNSDDSRTNSPYQQYGTPFANMPKKEDAIIYQVNLRSFSQEGTINGVRARLSDIKALGANVVYLMPIYPVGVLNSAGGLGSPYSVKDYKAVSPEFGTLEDLKALVNEAHAMDMAVVLDWVANHTSWDNAWITEHPEWYQQDADGNIIMPPNTNYADVAQLNFNNKEMRAAMIDAMSYWVYNANIDGFRCDYADMVPQNFWTEAITKLRSIKNQQLLMLAEGSKPTHFQSGFDYTFGFNFFGAMKNLFEENLSATTLQTSNATEYATNYVESQRVVRYTTNHDVNWTDGTPTELFGGKDGAMAAFVVASYMKSVPMIYNGQEIAYAQRLEYFNRTPIDWTTADNSILEQYKKVIAFRKTSNAVKSGSFTGFSSDAISAFTMVKGTEKVLVLVNLTNASTNYIVPSALSATTWTNALTAQPSPLANQITLAPYQYLILKN